MGCFLEINRYQIKSSWNNWKSFYKSVSDSFMFTFVYVLIYFINFNLSIIFTTLIFHLLGPFIYLLLTLIVFQTQVLTSSTRCKELQENFTRCGTSSAIVIMKCQSTFVIAQCVIWKGNAGDKTPENFLDFGFFVQEQSHTEEKSMENDHSSLWLCFFYLVIFCFKIPNFIILIQSH